MNALPPDELALWLARILRRRGLEAPAFLLLSAHRPLARALGDGLLVLEPLLRPLGLSAPAGGLVRLLQDPEALDRLLEELEPA